MSNYAKTIVASVAAVLLAGVTSWQTISYGAPFRLVDALPIAVAVVSAVLVYLVPNVPELPWAKGGVSAILAVLTAASTALVGNNAHVDVAAAVVAGLSALATWYVPNLAPAVGAVAALGTAATHAAAGHAQLSDVTDALQQLEQLDPAVAAKASAAPAVDERSDITEALAKLDSIAPPDDPVPAPSSPAPEPAESGTPTFDQVTADLATTVIPAAAPAEETRPMAAVANGTISS